MIETKKQLLHHEMPQTLVDMLAQWANDYEKVITVEVKELNKKTNVQSSTYVFNHDPQNT